MKFPDELIEDSVTMVSELATNAFRHATDFGIRGSSSHVGLPELWLYRRGQGAKSQFVCKVFDPSRRWSDEETETNDDDLRDGGRGLDVVAALSHGQWGVHLTRSRLGQWPVPGKASWFATSMAHTFYEPAYEAAEVPDPAPEAAQELTNSLGARGISRVYCRDDGRGQSVVSVRTGLTVWVRDGIFAWETKADGAVRHPVTDLAEVAEEVVRVHEELEAAALGVKMRPVGAST